MPNPTSHRLPIRLALWYGKGGVGKSTTTVIVALLAAQANQRVLTIDLDPECGTSRDFLGAELPRVSANVKTFLESPVPVTPPIVPAGIAGIDLLPCPPDQQRFFRFFEEHSTRLRDGLALLPPDYDWIVMDVANQFDNLAQLGLIAADYVILPVELTADCVERVGTALRVLGEVAASNPSLRVLGALPLASAPRAGLDRGLSAKERLVYAEYEAAFRPAGIRFFRTTMFRTATTVEEARSNAEIGLLHWTARRRFHRLRAEILARVRAHQSTRSTSRPHRPPHRRHAQRRPLEGRAKTPAHA